MWKIHDSQRIWWNIRQPRKAFSDNPSIVSLQSWFQSRAWKKRRDQFLNVQVLSQTCHVQRKNGEEVKIPYSLSKVWRPESRLSGPIKSNRICAIALSICVENLTLRGREFPGFSFVCFSSRTARTNRSNNSPFWLLARQWGLVQMKGASHHSCRTRLPVSN